MHYDIILINPQDWYYEKVKARRVPLGLLMLAAMLEREQYRVKIIDCYEENIDSTGLMLKLQNTDCRIFGISGTTNVRFESFKIAKAIKADISDAVVIYGGVNATFTWKEILERIRDIDIVVRGEGEGTIVELMDCLIRQKGKLEDIKGISIRRDGKIVDNGPRGLIHNLDELPYPAYHLINIDNYDFDLPYTKKKAGIIQSSRGCPARCEFCSTGAMWGAKFRFKSPKAVADEMEWLINECKVGGIKFIDDAMTWKQDYIMAIIDEMVSRRINIPWMCESRVSSLNKQIIRRMRKSGCIRIAIGVESGSDRILRRIKKGTRVEQVRKVVDWCQEVEMKVKAYFIIGHATETVFEAMETIRFIKELKKGGCHTSTSYGTVVFPGTATEVYAREKEILPPGFSWTSSYHSDESSRILGQDPRVPVLLQEQLGLKELEKMKYLLIKESMLDREFLLNRVLPKLTSIREIARMSRSLIRLFKNIYLNHPN